jgi:hypothetical protein
VASIRRWLILCGIYAITLMSGGAASAEVLDSAAGGFTVSHTIQLAAAPLRVYSEFVRIGEWWHPEHTFSGNSRYLSLDARPNGCFCEIWAEGTGVRHMTVVYADPGKLLRMTGGLGPLQALGVAGSLTLTFSKTETGTKLEMVYRVGGYYPKGLDSLAPTVDAVLGQQISRFKRFVETGKPAE